jgi:hypothetical protein
MNLSSNVFHLASDAAGTSYSIFCSSYERVRKEPHKTLLSSLIVSWLCNN